jgi:hypothetical protein
MYKLIVSLLLFSITFIFYSTSFAQDYKDINVVLIQTYKLKGPMGSDAEAFREMLKRQGDVFNKDPRVISTYVLRHFWGADSRDLVIVTEFKNYEDLFSFSNEMNSMLEKVFTKEQLDADDVLWNKYVGQHADEIYQLIPGTKK